MNVDLLQGALATIDKPVRCTCLHNQDIAGNRILDFVPDYKSRISLLYDDDFVVVMEMQRRALPRLRFDKEDRNPNIPLLRPDEVIRTPDKG